MSFEGGSIVYWGESMIRIRWAFAASIACCGLVVHHGFYDIW